VLIVDKYLMRPTEIVDLLRRLSSADKKLFLITNSSAEFVWVSETVSETVLQTVSYYKQQRRVCVSLWNCLWNCSSNCLLLQTAAQSLCESLKLSLKLFFKLFLITNSSAEFVWVKFYSIKYRVNIRVRVFSDYITGFYIIIQCNFVGMDCSHLHMSHCPI